MSTQRVGRRRRKTLGRRKMKKSFTKNRRWGGGERTYQVNQLLPAYKELGKLDYVTLDYGKKTINFLNEDDERKTLSYSNAVIQNSDRTRLNKITGIALNPAKTAYTVSYDNLGRRGSIDLQYDDEIIFTV